MKITESYSKHKQTTVTATMAFNLRGALFTARNTHYTPIKPCHVHNVILFRRLTLYRIFITSLGVHSNTVCRV